MNNHNIENSNEISTKNIKFKTANKGNLYDIKLCADEFLDFFENFKKKFLNNKLIVLTANYNNILIGIIVAEDKSYKINSVERMLPMMCIHLIYVNSSFREQGIGSLLLEKFIKGQKESGIASVYAKIPKKYIKGIQFYLKNNFHIIDRKKNKIFLKRELWNDFGIKKCYLIGSSLNDIFT
jgi:GNAT superfamily N-acetyltransferase